MATHTATTITLMAPTHSGRSTGGYGAAALGILLGVVVAAALAIGASFRLSVGG